ncbi:sensor histidine kinase [Nonomuraea sp. NPDC050404]|uniref:sensor histidine kinase n=1 Tax=Nonomuraea sp. NPDC050404 TaxID=3155783 RepID=UPI00340F495F
MIRVWRALPVPARDGVLAALTAVAIVVYTTLREGNSGVVTPLWIVLVCAVCAPLTVRRRLPMTAALLSGTIVLLAATLGQPAVGAGVAVTVAAFASAAYHGERRRWLPAVATAGWLLAMQLASGDPAGLFMSVTSGLAPVAFAHILRLRHDQARQTVLLERAQERTRIAREVHDVVGHHLSAIRLQAVGARRGTPADAARALETISEVSATALAETRRLLGLLRDGDHADADLRSLLTRLSRQGLRVRLDGDPPHEDVPSSVRYALYRIVQESLTNVMRHSGVTRATLRIRHRNGSVAAVVEDDGHALPGAVPPEGAGLPGMRERVAQLGGTFCAGPRTPHGWRVSVHFPLGGTRAPDEPHDRAERSLP